MRSRPWWVVDAFTTTPFAGNPAGVLLLDEGDDLDDGLMQAIAAEANQSETAFVRPRDDGRYDLRWCTPTDEVDLCGHATLAAGHVLVRERDIDDARFVTRSGELRAAADGSRVRIDLPAVPAVPEQDPDLVAAVANALGASPTELLGTRNDPHDDRNLLAVFDDAATVRGLRPDVAAVSQLAGGLIATAPGDDADTDCVSRYFTPQHGIPEDPVTGSAHCTLGPFWCERLGLDRLRAEQASPRGGRLLVEPRDGRVVLTGHAVTVVTGELHLPSEANRSDG